MSSWSGPLLRQRLVDGELTQPERVGVVAFSRIPGDEMHLAVRWQLDGQSSFEDECLVDRTEVGFGGDSLVPNLARGWVEPENAQYRLQWVVEPRNSQTRRERPDLLTFSDAGAPIWLTAHANVNIRNANSATQNFQYRYYTGSYPGGRPTQAATQSCLDAPQGCAKARGNSGKLKRKALRDGQIDWDLDLRRIPDVPALPEIVRTDVVAEPAAYGAQIRTDFYHCELLPEFEQCPVVIELVAEGETGLVVEKVDLGSGERTAIELDENGTAMVPLAVGRFRFEAVRSRLRAKSTSAAGFETVAVSFETTVTERSASAATASVRKSGSTCSGTTGGWPSSGADYCEPDDSQYGGYLGGGSYHHHNFDHGADLDRRTFFLFNNWAGFIRFEPETVGQQRWHYEVTQLPISIGDQPQVISQGVLGGFAHQTIVIPGAVNTIPYTNSVSYKVLFTPLDTGFSGNQTRYKLIRWNGIDPTPIAADAYEVDNGSATSMLIQDGDSQLRNFHYSQDSDWIKLTVAAGDVQTITLTPQAASSGNKWQYQVQKLQSGGGTTVIKANTGFGQFPVSQTYVLDANVHGAGEYYVGVSQIQTGLFYGVQSIYTAGLTVVSAIQPDTYEQTPGDDTRPNATAITTTGAPQDHNFHVGTDRDWMSYTPPMANTTVAFAIAPQDPNSTAPRFVAQLWTEYTAGVPVAVSAANGGTATFGYPGTTLSQISTRDNQKYWLEMYSYNSGDTSFLGDPSAYTVTLSATPNGDIHEPDNTLLNARVLLAGQTETHDFHIASDEDWFEVVLPENGEANFTFAPETGSASSPNPWTVRAYRDSESSMVGSYSFGSTELNFTVTHSGNGTTPETIYVKLAPPTNPTVLGNASRYTAHVVTSTGDIYEPDNTINDPTPLTATTQTHDFHVATDEDWFEVVLPENGEANFTFAPETGNASSPNPWTVRAYRDSESSNVGSYSFGSTELNFTVTHSGNGTTPETIYVKLAPPTNPTVLGNASRYTAHVVTSTGDIYEPDNTINDPTPLTATTQTHDFHVATDEDWFEVEIESDEEVVFTFAPETANSIQPDPWDVWTFRNNIFNQLLPANSFGSGVTYTVSHSTGVGPAETIYVRVAPPANSGFFGPQSEYTASAVVSTVGGNLEPPPPPAPNPNFPFDATSAISATTGATRGQFRVDESGAATYSIPLMTVPGSGNMAPEMSLAYSSRGGDGPLGQGWQITGQSAISRCGQAVEFGDAAAMPVTLTDTDRFCLDGQRLQLVNGNYGQVDSEYRLEVDQLVKVTLTGVTAAARGQTPSPAVFEVRRKDGTKSTYGSGKGSDSARITIPGSGTIYAWPLARVEDSAGNFMQYDYYQPTHTDPAVEFALEKVSYTGNGVNLPFALIEFEYVQREPSEQRLAYVAGAPMRASLQMSAIRSKLVDGTLIRRYALTYQDDGSSSAFSLLGREILTAVSECYSEASADCLPATVFDWVKGSHLVGTPAIIDGTELEFSDFRTAIPIDFDGDGRQGLVVARGKIGEKASLRGFVSGSDGRLVPTNEVDAACELESQLLGQIQPIDLRGTGFQGFVYVAASCTAPSNNGIYYHSVTAGVLSEAELVGNIESGLSNSAEVSVVDWNGDGLADLVVSFVGAGSEGRTFWGLSGVVTGVRVYPNIPTNTLPFPNGHVVKGGFDWLNPMSPPRGCDPGPADIPLYSFLIEPHRAGAFTVDGGGEAAFAASARVRLECVSNLPMPTGTGVTNYSAQDFNIGAVEVIADRSRVYKIVQDGNEYVLQTYDNLTADNPDPIHQPDFVLPTDVNSDGLTDFVVVNTLAGACPSDQCPILLHLNTGAATNPLAVATTQLNVPKSLARYVRLLDYNGDGAPDLLVPDSASTLWKFHPWEWTGDGVGHFRVQGVVGGLSAGDLAQGWGNVFLDRDGNGWNDQIQVQRIAFDPVNGDNTWKLFASSGSLNNNCVLAAAECNYRNLHSINRVTDGLGAWTDIEYRSLAQRRVYTRDAAGPYQNWGEESPVYDLIAPMYVVSSATSLSPQVVIDADGMGSSAPLNQIATTRYYYTGGKIQAGGRGFLGFAQVASYDPQTGMLTRTHYKQQFPHIGMPEYTETSYVASSAFPWPQLDAQTPVTLCAPLLTCANTAISSGTLMGKTINVWGAVSTVAGLVHPYLSQSVDLSYTPVIDAGVVTAEFNRRVETSNSNVDPYGNIRQVMLRTYTTASGPSGEAGSQVTVNAYDNNAANWHLGRLSCATVTSTRSGAVPPGSITRRSSFGYDSTTGILTRETVQPNSCTNTAGFELNTVYELNDFGLKTKSTVTARGASLPRVSRMEYDDGRFVHKQYAVLNGVDLLTSEVLARDHYGNATQVTNGQGVAAYAYFDRLGRPHYSYSADGSWSRVLHAPGAGAYCPDGTELHENHSAADGSSSVVCKDILGRETRRVGFTIEEQPGNPEIYVDTHYDYASRPVETSEPYFPGATIYWTRTVFDEFGRVEFVLYPDDSMQSNQYRSLDTRSTNSLLQTTRTQTNVFGESIADTADYLGADQATTSHIYDALGRLTETDGPLTTNDVISVEYTVTGHKTQVADPDKGIWNYRHNGFGELICQVDTKGQGIYHVYDNLGRLTNRYERSGVNIETCVGTTRGTSTWTYDNTTGDGSFGQVTADSYSYNDATVGTHTVTHGYVYDTLGRVSTKNTSVVEGASVQPVIYQERITYDQFGRVFQALDASGGNRGLRSVYGSRGQMVGLREAAGDPNDYYWQLKATDARGQTTKAELGNGYTALATYEPDTGRLISLLDSNGQTLAQNMTLQWDTIGNLTYRRDQSNNRNQSERFAYDDRNRLLQTFDTNGNLPPAPEVPGPYQTYDPAGNITHKSDVGPYTYTGASPHAVTNAGGVIYSYDANGNMTSDTSGRTLNYGLKDQAVRISKGSARSEFHYGHAGQRLVRRDLTNGIVDETTHYIGSVEVLTDSSGSRQFRRMIGGTAIATWYEASGATQLRYLHKDHLGSITAISNELGAVVTWMGYDPWGKRRDADAWNLNQPPPAGVLSTMLAITPRGFTGHEQIDALGIVHMNGRIYDPTLGRFLQADILIEDVTTLNRYTYVHNNPLAYTDPSGYSSVGQWFRTAAAIAITVYTGGAAGSLWSFFGAPLQGATAFAAVVGAGAVAGAIQSGTVEGAAWGAFSAAVFYGLGQGIKNAGTWAKNGAGGLSGPGFAVKTISHGIAGGTISHLQGGKFGNGFLSAAGSAATTPFADTSSARGAWGGAIVAALAGGTVSRLSGGKFGNGAVTAAMSYAFNQLASSDDARGGSDDDKPTFDINSLPDEIKVSVALGIVREKCPAEYGCFAPYEFSLGDLGSTADGLGKTNAWSGNITFNYATLDWIQEKPKFTLYSAFHESMHAGDNVMIRARDGFLENGFRYDTSNHELMLNRALEMMNMYEELYLERLGTGLDD